LRPPRALLYHCFMMTVPIQGIAVGDRIVIQREVRPEHTAANYGSGQLGDLLSTPGLVGFMIEAAVKLIDPKLPEGFRSVGIMVQVVHTKPTVLGVTVSVEMEVRQFDGEKILLAMKAFDEVGEIGNGLHQRAIVNDRALHEKARLRAQALQNKDY